MGPSKERFLKHRSCAFMTRIVILMKCPGSFKRARLLGSLLLVLMSISTLSLGNAFFLFEPARGDALGMGQLAAGSVKEAFKVESLNNLILSKDGFVDDTTGIISQSGSVSYSVSPNPVLSLSGLKNISGTVIDRRSSFFATTRIASSFSYDAGTFINLSSTTA